MRPASREARTGQAPAAAPLPPAASPRDHYSYAVYADRAVAERFDAIRFGGPIGALLAEAQERILAGVLEDLSDPTILDVGTGTGRAALVLARRGARVTGVDASAEMLEVAIRRAQAEAVAITFALGDAHVLGFSDRSFDVAVSLRVLMHAPDWGRCLAELCRVARHRIVVDYPAVRSAATLQVLARRIQHAVGGRTEPYRVFRDHQIATALARHGFRVASRHRQFVLPIALHKWVGARRVTERVEGALAAVGLLRLLGSPVTIVAERCGS